MAQVVIVGAGPAGATLALLLVKRGIFVKSIEASRDFRRSFRGEALVPSGLDALEQMGMADFIHDLPHTYLDGWEVIIGDRSLFKVDEPLEENGKACTLISQPHLLEKLIAEASLYEEFEFINGEAVKDVIKNESGRVSGVKLANGREITADLVIAADGRNSIVRQKAGLNLTQLSNNIDILWFRLNAGSIFARENIFTSIVKNRNAFGAFKSSEGQLHIGWGLHAEDNLDWKQANWKEILIAASPPWLAEHIVANVDRIDKPLLLSVIIGLCDRWSQPGLLLLGDAVHPMSPIRAQGINMALRDVIVAANYIVPVLSKKDISYDAIDAVLPCIRQEREPEIVRIQQLQQEEMAQAAKLRHIPLLRWGAKTFAPIISPFITYSWLKRQKQLRQGITEVKLEV